ncbi:MAG: aspartate aminotransferase family protein [Candidatus Baltobacteraceae bacterium]
MLDPADWERFRRTAHEALDDAIDSMRDVRDGPVWQAVPAPVKEALRAPMPQAPSAFEDVYAEYKTAIAPYAGGNVHPRFWGWVHGSGTAGGAIAELLAAALNANTGGRDHGAIYVERQVIRWFCDLFGWPQTASGVLLTGTSAANAAAVLVARTKARAQVRERGLDQSAEKLTGYASSATHACVRKAFENAGLGSQALRVLPVDGALRLDTAALREAIAADRREGCVPFFVVANAGTVDTAAIDPLEQIAGICAQEGLWFHVDGAFGATAYLSQVLRPLLRGIECADSIAFDFHKWLHVPYDAGCVLVRDGAIHRATFASEGPYITRTARGLAAGEPWFTDFGPDLSRGFRALKVWFTIKEHGTAALASAMERNCAQAQLLANLVERSADFELAAPPVLQIVCLRPRLPATPAEQADRLTDEAVIRLQESGIAVLSATTLGGRRAMRVCITNHRTRDEDLHLLMETLARIVEELRSTPTV